MSSQLLSALAKLDDSIRVLEQGLNSLGAGLDVSKEQFIQTVIEARQNVEAVRELIRAKRPDVDWTDRESLEKLIQDLEAAEAGRKEQRRRKLSELADELKAGTITHRLKSRVTALESIRELAVREILTEAANNEPKELPGPAAPAWLHWALGLQGDATSAQFSELEKDFPALVVFVSEMEESYWQPRESSPETSQDAAVAEPPSASRLAVQPPPLSESAPAFAAKYGHLSATKASQVEAASTSSTASVASRAQLPEVHAPAATLSANPNKDSKETQPPASILADLVKVPVASSVIKDSPQAAEPKALESPFNFSSYSSKAQDAVEVERKGFRFNRSVLITAGIIAAVALAVVVISAVSGSVSAKRSSSRPETTATDSAKEAPGAPAAPVSDIELVGQIEQKLKAINGGSIYVTVQHGTAILEGQVPSQEALSQAEELTLQSSQIKVVRNRLQVAKAAAPRSTSAAAKPGTPNSQ